jgi:chemosensory pili system protein ChpC
MANQAVFVRSLLIPIGDGNLLMPTAVVAEVAPWQAAQAVSSTQPEWLAGIINWRNQRVPLLDLPQLLGLSATEGKTRSARTVVLYGLESPQTMPFYAFHASDVPRTINIAPETLSNPTEEQKQGLIFRVKLTANEFTWLPDLTYFENLLRKSQNIFLVEA